MAIIISEFEVSINCPSNPLVGQDATTQADMSFKAQNTGDDTATISFSLQVQDSDGNVANSPGTLTLGPGLSDSGETSCELKADYMSTGSRTATATATADTESQSTNCSFTVIQGARTIK